MSALMAAAILVTAPLPDVEQVDVAYDEMLAGRSETAIAQIESVRGEAAEHPASLINLGIAYARQGDQAKARALFQRAAAASERFQLETSQGSWVDSRALARRALAALDRGAFAASATRTALR
jgi:Tfp pilus assembly protein PilF